MTQIDTDGIRSLGKRLSANLGYGFIKDFLDNDIPAIADELDALRQQLADAQTEIKKLLGQIRDVSDIADARTESIVRLNKRIGELESLLPKPPEMPETVVYEGGKPPRQYLREGD